MATNYAKYPPLPSGGGGSGVTSLNSLTGALSLIAGSGITITPSGSDITIASTGGGGGSPGGADGSIQFNDSGSFNGFGSTDNSTFIELPFELILDQQTGAVTPPSGADALYFGSLDELFSQDSSGNAYQITYPNTTLGLLEYGPQAFDQTIFWNTDGSGGVGIFTPNAAPYNSYAPGLSRAAGMASVGPIYMDGLGVTNSGSGGDNQPYFLDTGHGIGFISRVPTPVGPTVTFTSASTGAPPTIVSDTNAGDPWSVTVTYDPTVTTTLALLASAFIANQGASLMLTPIVTTPTAAVTAGSWSSYTTLSDFPIQLHLQNNAISGSTAGPATLTLGNAFTEWELTNQQGAGLGINGLAITEWGAPRLNIAASAITPFANILPHTAGAIDIGTDALPIGNLHAQTQIGVGPFSLTGGTASLDMQIFSNTPLLQFYDGSTALNCQFTSATLNFDFGGLTPVAQIDGMGYALPSGFGRFGTSGVGNWKTLMVVGTSALPVRQIVSSPGNFTVSNGISNVTLTWGSTSSTCTITLPSSMDNGQFLYISANTSTAITAVTFTPAGGASLAFTPPTGIQAGTGITLFFDLNANAWYRANGAV
jgi:hypothetical protein